MSEEETAENILRALRPFIKITKGTEEDPDQGITVKLTLGDKTYTGKGVLGLPHELNTAAVALYRVVRWVDTMDKKEHKVERQRGSSVRDTR